MLAAKHIGIVACSAEGAALCYRTICAEAAARMGAHRHPEITMHTYPLADYLTPDREDDWEGIASLMLASVRKLAEAGAQFAICPDNTIHQAFHLVAPESPIPWLHIAEVVGRAAQAAGYAKLGVLGTKSLMTGPVYAEALDRLGIAHETPPAEDRERLQDIIFNELVCGNVRDDSRRRLNEMIARLRDRGCQAAVLGCTELPLLADPQDCPLPTLDSTRLLARAALDAAIVEPPETLEP